MTINSVLAGAGAFASRKPIPKRVKLPTPDGEMEVELYFLDLPAADVRELLSTEGGERDAKFICATLCNEDGSPGLELDGPHGAMSLKVRTLRALVDAALDALCLKDAARDAVKKD